MSTFVHFTASTKWRTIYVFLFPISSGTRTFILYIFTTWTYTLKLYDSCTYFVVPGKVIPAKTGRIEETGVSVSVSHIISSNCENGGQAQHCSSESSAYFRNKSPDLTQQYTMIFTWYLLIFFSFLSFDIKYLYNENLYMENKLFLPKPKYPKMCTYFRVSHPPWQD